MDVFSKFSSLQSLSRVRLCDSRDCSTPGLPVHHQIPELTQTHVCRVGDAIQPRTSSSVVPFSSCLQSFPTSGSFQVSQLFASGGKILLLHCLTKHLVFGCRLLTGCVAVSYYGFHLHFPNDYWGWIYIYVLIGYLYLFFDKVSVLIFRPFLSCFLLLTYFFLYILDAVLCWMYCKYLPPSVVCLFIFLIALLKHNFFFYTQWDIIYRYFSFRVYVSCILAKKFCQP